MSSYTPEVQQNEYSNCVMLELDNKVVNHARKVADKLNELYYEKRGHNQSDYTSLYSVLVDMLEIQLEQECRGGIFENNDPDHPNVFGLHYDRVKKKGLS